MRRQTDPYHILFGDVRARLRNLQDVSLESCSLGIDRRRVALILQLVRLSFCRKCSGLV